MPNRSTVPKDLLVEAYRQAHETRRKWENYIWQWNIVLTILAAIFVTLSQSAPPLPSFSFPQKVALSVISLFVFTIFLNVFRARVLMKELEKTITAFHSQMGIESPIVPLELDKNLSRLKKVSSTKMSACCHFAAAIVFLIIALYAWFK